MGKGNVTKREIFANRGKRIETDFLVYDSMSEGLRVQIRYIWEDSLALEKAYDRYGNAANENFDYIRNHLCRELGLNSLYEEKFENLSCVEECVGYLMNGDDMDVLLSLIELSIVSMEDLHKLPAEFPETYFHEGYKFKKNQEMAIEELNDRFKKAGFGYEFSHGMLIRKDSEILHEEAVKPALYLLKEHDFEGALNEFLEAHDHYRKAKYKESIVCAGKAFESTMRTIGSKEDWGLTTKESALDLIKILIEKKVIPSYMRNTLEGLGTLRNKVAHGQGEKIIVAPEHLVNYALHLCGTNIVMLIEAYKTYKREMGRIRDLVLVTGKVLANGSPRGEKGFEFEIELPYKDISEDTMSIQESNALIFSAINKKYGTDFFQNGYYVNPLYTNPKEEIY